MAPTEAEIRLLLSSTNYSPSNIAQLEAYLKSCLSGDVPYIFDAFRSLIKHYQLFPENFNGPNVSRCFLLAMLRYPNSSDLLALSYMISSTVLAQEPCHTIQKCATSLDGCQFTEFWKLFEELQSYSEDSAISLLAKKSVVTLQESILAALSFSYKEAPAAFVLKCLNVGSVSDIPAHSCVEKCTADSVVFLPTADNTKRQRVYQDGVNFSTISSLLNKISQ